MCGIVGYVVRDEAPGALPRMLAAVAHRGPDGEGTWTRTVGAWRVALGNRRLAILDTAGGAQPLTDETGSSCVTFNGEIVNYRELAAPLSAAGERFRTRSDTEVLLTHLRAHGLGGIAALDGMFAFAAWDEGQRRLVLARDRMGIKPLHYAPLADGGVVFASELSALLQHPGVGRELDLDALADYFFADHAAPPRTLLRGAHKLRPGHYLTWQDGVLSEQHAFWRMPALQRWDSEGSADSLAEEAWERLVAAVTRYQVADVPVGFFVSGGIDSAVVASAARRRTGAKLRTFSLAFSEPSYDESAYSRLVSAALASDHTEVRLDGSTWAESLPRIAASLDEPLADPSYVPTYLLSEAAARSVKVVLGGDGGDELWGGYLSYVAHRLAPLWHAVPAPIRNHVVAPAIARLPVGRGYQGLDFKLRRFVLRWEDDRLRRHLRWMGSIDLPELRRLMPSFDRDPPTLGFRVPTDSGDPLAACLALDLSTYLPNTVLTKVDRAGMAHGLEVRPPHLANDLVEWAARLPTRYKVRGLETKWLLRRAARGRIPQPIVTRRKHGFGAPMGELFRGDFARRMDAILMDSPAWEGGHLARAVAADWLEEHRARRADHSHALWAIFVLDGWMRRHDVRWP